MGRWTDVLQLDTVTPAQAGVHAGSPPGAPARVRMDSGFRWNDGNPRLSLAGWKRSSAADLDVPGFDRLEREVVRPGVHAGAGRPLRIGIVVPKEGAADPVLASARLAIVLDGEEDRVDQA